MVGVLAVSDRGDFDDAAGVINEVDDAVGPPPRRPQRRERRVEGLADRVGGVEQGTGDELVRGGGDLLGQQIGEGARGRSRDPQPVSRSAAGLVLGHPPRPERRR